ncbi:hypothetical protein DFA_09173 [Cavenderia fasciculata]|uniref:Uncharacterized protein n=1 Tax=Cavenderia fasciculata TaxID=261658 RepID=F4Q6W6_CACFS|nr:uncharacterized protein DFA_09173 [Cavenderia fasciculata]EGG16148.1 hypothetical protein DFA_09173 [Cavenderia fasciculata]|eukprot:XP_004352601.1 hypothetical protein DFA_09173 [Cavenderia fasciculata]
MSELSQASKIITNSALREEEKNQCRDYLKSDHDEAPFIIIKQVILLFNEFQIINDCTEKEDFLAMLKVLLDSPKDFCSTTL